MLKKSPIDITSWILNLKIKFEVESKSRVLYYIIVNIRESDNATEESVLICTFLGPPPSKRCYLIISYMWFHKEVRLTGCGHRGRRPQTIGRHESVYYMLGCLR